MTVALTEGALRNSYLTLSSCIDFFPPEALGGFTAEESGTPLTLEIVGVGEVTTDINGPKQRFRERGAWHRFYEQHDLRAGDVVEISRAGPLRYRIEPRHASGDPGAMETGDHEYHRVRVWLVRGGRGGGEEPVALERGRAVIGWEQIGDLADVESQDAVAALLEGSDRKYESKGTRTRDAGELWDFVRAMAPGDLVVMPLLSRGGLWQLARWPAHTSTIDFPPYAKHTRPVRWLKNDVPREWLATLGTALSSRGTVGEVSTLGAEDALRAALAGIPVEPSSGTRAWLFNANPKFYDIEGAVRSLAEMNWTVAQYSKQIHAGDAVYLWESGPAGGLLASGTILTEPQLMPDQDGLQFIRDQEKFAGEQLRVRLAIGRVLDEPVHREALKEDPVLKDLAVLKFANATNFDVTPEQNEALIELFEQSGRPRRRGVDYEEPSLDSIAARIADEGLRIDARTLRRFHLSLKTRGFVILSGVSGTGKTWSPSFTRRLSVRVTSS